MADADDSTPNGNGVRISNLLIYNMLMTVRDQVGLMVDQNRRGDEIHKDHEGRIAILERKELEHAVADDAVRRSEKARSEFWRWFVPAIATVALVVVTVMQVVH